MPATFLWFLFDWRGRIGRSAYRIAILVLALVVGALQLAPDNLRPLLIGVVALQVVVQAALDAKRLHDIGMSAFWVVATSLASVGATAALAVGYPDALTLMTEQLAEIIGPHAAGEPAAAIALAGLGLAAFVRSTLLWLPKSRSAGDVYAYDPLHGRLAAAGAETSSAIDADRLIAQALAESRTRDLRATLKDMQRPAGAAPGSRKSFGRRTA